jgi:hypothetical protein
MTKLGVNNRAKHLIDPTDICSKRSWQHTFCPFSQQYINKRLLTECVHSLTKRAVSSFPYLSPSSEEQFCNQLNCSSEHFYLLVSWHWPLTTEFIYQLLNCKKLNGEWIYNYMKESGMVCHQILLQYSPRQRNKETYWTDWHRLIFSKWMAWISAGTPTILSEIYHWFSSVPSVKFWDSVLIKLSLLPSQSFIHQSSY